MTVASEKLNNLIAIGKDNSGLILTILIFFMITLFILYAYVTLRRQTFNCETLSKNRVTTSMKNINDSSNLGEAYNSTLKECIIKTAHNCCCTGDFRNDYVDYCGLLNAAKQGFRALDFQIFSLNGQPVVSESTASNNNYKEMYNSLPFNDVLLNINRYFIQDIMNCPNVNDPLFLIFRFKTNNINVFDIMAKSLNTVFGRGSSIGNILYVPETTATIDTAIIRELCKKVIIIVDKTGLTNFESSQLNSITALTLGTVNNQIYRESEVVSNMVNDTNFTDTFKNYVNMLYPDIGASSENYDFVTTGINTGIQFIALNAQTTDTYLTKYNTNYFNQYSIIKKKLNTTSLNTPSFNTPS
jgi:hypothetical protein